MPNQWNNGRLGPPLRVWQYRGWCAVCNICRKGIVVGRPAQFGALVAALHHLETEHGT